MAALSGLDVLRGKRVYVDANVFIYFLDGSTRWAKPAKSILVAAQSGTIAAITGEAAVAEVMVGPYRSGDPMLVRSAHEFFATPRFVDVVSHSAQAWDDAAMLRGTLDIPLMDGLHLATAAQASCAAIVTNDDRMKSALAVEIIPLHAFP